MGRIEVQRLNRWYFGGLAAAMGVCVTHPLDLMKVQLQTQETHVEKKTLTQLARALYKTQGILGFYNGLSASVTRQLTYTTTRIAVYEAGKDYVAPDSFSKKAYLAFIAGLCGGAIGVPFDVVNVRMQNDMKLAPENRRNYKHIFDGLARVAREEGWQALFRGMTMTQSRSVLLTIGQNAVYEETKEILCPALMKDGQMLYLTASGLAGGICTLLTQPLDVLKTRGMNAGGGENAKLLNLIVATAKEGPLAFYKGVVPAFTRMLPQTVLLFMFMEQLRINFGKAKIEPEDLNSYK